MGVKQYDKTFKEQAVKLSQHRGNINAVSRELGISSSQLSKWCSYMKVYKDQSFPGRGIERLTDEQQEIKELRKELKDKELDLEILKKSDSLLFTNRQIKYMVINNYRHRFSVVKMALHLGVSVSSYYDYCKCRYLKRETKKVFLSQKIRDCFYDCHQLYGSRRLSVELIRDHVWLSHTTVAKYMRQMGLRSKFYRKYRTTTDSKHSNMMADIPLRQRRAVHLF